MGLFALHVFLIEGADSQQKNRLNTLRNGRCTNHIYENLRILSGRRSHCWTHRLYRLKDPLTEKRKVAGQIYLRVACELH